LDYFRVNEASDASPSSLEGRRIGKVTFVQCWIPQF
jgi:hypothetical protein